MTPNDLLSGHKVGSLQLVIDSNDCNEHYWVTDDGEMKWHMTKVGTVWRTTLYFDDFYKSIFEDLFKIYVPEPKPFDRSPLYKTV